MVNEKYTFTGLEKIMVRYFPSDETIISDIMFKDNNEEISLDQIALLRSSSLAFLENKRIEDFSFSKLATDLGEIENLEDLQRYRKRIQEISEINKKVDECIGFWSSIGE